MKCWLKRRAVSLLYKLTGKHVLLFECQEISEYPKYDLVEAMLYANFQMLSDFVEHEQEHGKVDWYHPSAPRTSIAWEEALDLYDWWHHYLPLEGELFRDIETEQLQRLMAIRHYLWD